MLILYISLAFLLHIDRWMVSSSTSTASTKTVNPSSDSDRVNAKIEKIASELSGEKKLILEIYFIQRKIMLKL
jgi:hypothetical protein